MLNSLNTEYKAELLKQTKQQTEQPLSPTLIDSDLMDICWRFVTNIFFFLVLGLNLGSHDRQVGAPPLEPLDQPCD
jgi:hypothetical protein